MLTLGTLFHPSKKSLSPHIFLLLFNTMMYIQLFVNSLWIHLCLFEKITCYQSLNHVLVFICIFGWKIILKMHKNSFCRGELSISPNIKSLKFMSPSKAFMWLLEFLRELMGVLAYERPIYVETVALRHFRFKKQTLQFGPDKIIQ